MTEIISNKIAILADLIDDIKRDMKGDLVITIKKDHPLFNTILKHVEQKKNPKTAKELYARKPEYITTNIIEYLYGCYYNHLAPFIDIQYDENIKKELLKQDKIEIHVYKHYDFDGRRFWRLSAVKFENDFVMIIQNAGREGDDHSERFITNIDKFKEMIKYIRNLINNIDFYDDVIKKDFIELDEEIPSLCDFYGNKLDGYFERY